MAFPPFVSSLFWEGYHAALRTHFLRRYLIASFGWHFLTRLKGNRLVNPDGSGNVPISEVEIPAEGRVVHLRDFGFVEKAQVWKALAILRHLLLALRAFLRLEVYRLRAGVNWYEAKLAIVREAIRAYLASPAHVLNPTA